MSRASRGKGGPGSPIDCLNIVLLLAAHCPPHSLLSNSIARAG